MAPFRLTLPAGEPGPVVFNSPHSGADYPRDFVETSQLSAHLLRSSEDAFVDALFDAAPAFGAPLLCARAPRAYVDLNRARDELDPAAVSIARRPGLNPRVSAGLGVIPRVVSEGRVIRSGRISAQSAEARLRAVYDPYHETLDRLLRRARLRHGHAFLIDCHSMPREALRGLGAEGDPRPEIVLGDRFGTSCSAWVLDSVRSAFVQAGFRVAVNRPFAGGYITRQHGRPGERRHAVQVEIDRSLYMDEARLEKRPDFAALRARLRPVIAELGELGRPRRALAAE